MRIWIISAICLVVLLIVILICFDSAIKKHAKAIISSKAIQLIMRRISESFIFKFVKISWNSLLINILKIMVIIILILAGIFKLIPHEAYVSLSANLGDYVPHLHLASSSYVHTNFNKNKYDDDDVEMSFSINTNEEMTEITYLSNGTIFVAGNKYVLNSTSSSAKIVFNPMKYQMGVSFKNWDSGVVESSGKSNLLVQMPEVDFTGNNFSVDFDSGFISGELAVC